MGVRSVALTPATLALATLAIKGRNPMSYRSLLQRLLPALVLLLALALPLGAEESSPETAPQPAAKKSPIPLAKPADVGLDAERLTEIDQAVDGLMAKRAFPGAIVAVARKGKVGYLKAFGSFKEDSIVRIYSMSKPITVAAALILVDDGKLALNDPVSKYIPAFAKASVQGAAEDAKPPVITVKHLMQHTAGLTYGLFSNTPSDAAYRKADVLSRDITLETMCNRLAPIPLLFEPGSKWHYSMSIDVLGRVIEVASGKRFDVFLKERLFDPLGMVDTGFHVPAEKVARFVPCYSVGGLVLDRVETSEYLKAPAMHSGGGGLVSTVQDYLRFALMLRGGGELDGTRILKTASVKQMATNHLPESLIPIRFAIPLQGLGFGLGVSVRVARAHPQTRVGIYGWSGAASTTWFNSPEDDLTVVTITQRMPFWTGLDRAVRGVVHRAVVPNEAAAPAVR